MINKKQVFDREIEFYKEIRIAPLGLLTEKEHAYRFLGLAAKDFEQGFQMIVLSSKCFHWHLKIASTYHLQSCLDFVLGTALQLKRMSLRIPSYGLSEYNVTVRGAQLTKAKRSHRTLIKTELQSRQRAARPFDRLVGLSINITLILM